MDPNALPERAQELRRKLIRNHQEVPRERYLRKLDLPGITLQDTQKRLYPLGSVAAQLVGMTDDWGAGLTGLEKTMESHLKGTEAALRSGPFQGLQQTITFDANGDTPRKVFFTEIHEGRYVLVDK